MMLLSWLVKAARIAATRFRKMVAWGYTSGRREYKAVEGSFFNPGVAVSISSVKPYPIVQNGAWMNAFSSTWLEHELFTNLIADISSTLAMVSLRRLCLLLTKPPFLQISIACSGRIHTSHNAVQ